MRPDDPLRISFRKEWLRYLAECLPSATHDTAGPIRGGLVRPTDCEQGGRLPIPVIIVSQSSGIAVKQTIQFFTRFRRCRHPQANKPHGDTPGDSPGTHFSPCVPYAFRSLDRLLGWPHTRYQIVESCCTDVGVQPLIICFALSRIPSAARRKQQGYQGAEHQDAFRLRRYRERQLAHRCLL